VRICRSLFAAVALLLAVALVPFVGAPLCSSKVCPMSAGDRAACIAMGRDCCGTGGGRISQATTAPVTLLAPAVSAVSLSAPVQEIAKLESASTPGVPPSVLQGIGLFTLHAVFLI
jgi:hypothetical protein